ncbi:hypothetical protein ABXN37_26735 [Piscinibacter sakaiensis]|uniref:Transmembrane protein n=2 Tax=Piscinibacter sakaiensis TaxID=1547922 RepID=A0A0K8P7S3_PISS1|nr:hypothetical protein ISF6_5251 [Piscinibacter sakaiensis]
MDDDPEPLTLRMRRQFDEIERRATGSTRRTLFAMLAVALGVGVLVLLLLLWR